MKKFQLYLITAIVFCVMLAPGNVLSQIKPGAFTISPVAGVHVFENKQDIEKDLVVGLGLGYNFTKNWAGEMMIKYGSFDYRSMHWPSCTCVEDDVDAYIVQLDALYHFQPEKRLVPYLAAGVGAIDLEFDKLESEMSTMFNWGGGVKYFINDKWALRGDVRHIFAHNNPDNNLSATVGVVYQFGEGKKPMELLPEEPPAEPDEGKELVGKPEEKPAPPAEPVEKPPLPIPDKEPKDVEKPIVTPPEGKPTWLNVLVEFDFDKSFIREIYHDDLKKVSDFMNENPDVSMIVEGHTDSIGTEEYNLALSDRRAQSTKKYLVENFGAPADRIETVSFGESMPIAPNTNDDGTDNPEGRQRNRRAVIKLNM